MAASGVRRNFSYLFGFLTVAMYFIGLFFINRGLGFRNAIIIVIALIGYYIANVYNVTASRYRLRDMATVIGINFILMFITTFAKIFSLNEGIILFGTISIFQIVFRYVVIMGIVEKQKIVFIGENDYTDDLKKSIENDGQYKLIAFLREDVSEFGKAVLKVCEVKKPDIIVDFTENLLVDPKLV
ncbi:MAG: sugar transferase, partial [Leptotrichiaceae bacterium]|nr:sugar transferase [Leptotrichiaceae bacterium]